jgi:hypothetical protein
MFSYILPFALFSVCVVHQLAPADGESSEAPAEPSSAATASATAAAQPQPTTARPPGPVTEDQIAITGQSTTNTAYVGDTLTCSSTCDPHADRFEWSREGLGLISNISTVLLMEEGRATYNCTVYNTFQSTSHSASKSLTVSIYPQVEDTTHHDKGLACVQSAGSWIVLLAALALQSLAMPLMA